jgi:MFS family permease
MGLLSGRGRGGTQMFYGWWIVGVAVLVNALSIGSTTYIFGQFVKPLAEEFGAARTQVMLGITLMLLLGGVGGPLLGREIDRRSLRAVMLWGCAALAAGFVALSTMPGLGALLLPLMLLVGPGMIAFGPLSVSTAVARWFTRRRGQALGIAAVGTSLGGLVLPPLNAWAIGEFGWRGALLLLALLIGAVGIPLVVWRMVNHPEDLGLAPDGDPPLAAVASASAEVGPRWRLGALLGQSRFWAIGLGIGLPLGVVGSVINNLPAYATDLGIADQVAAYLLSALSFGAVIGKLAFGTLADRIDKRRLLLVAQAMLVGFLVLLLRHPGPGPLMVGCAVAGLALGGFLPVWGAMLGDYYGRASYGQVMGLMGTVMLPPNLMAPVAGTWAYDATGRYDVAFQVFIGVVILASVLIVRLRPPRPELTDVEIARAGASA